MTSFSLLPALTRAFFALWTLLLCLIDIGSAALAAVKRRIRLTVFALLLFVPAYFLWQVIFDLSLSADAAGISLVLGGISWICWLGVLAVLTLTAALLFGVSLRYDKTSITPGAIKLYLDQIPCGICCWRDNGRVLFSNVCMNRLCIALTNSPLLNGNQFRDAVTGGILPLDGRVWRFSCREIPTDGETLHEMIAADITTEYAKTQVLEQDKAELSALNRQLQEYYIGIDDIIRRQEILQARVNIHDEMNRLMLSTTAANCDDTAALDRIFSLWEQNALLLCMEVDALTYTNATESLERLADALKIRLQWQSPLPAALSEQQRSLFFSVAQEAIINAVKHAEATTMTLSFAETETELFCRFANDGKKPSGDLRFTGGLANLSLLAAKQGAAIAAQTEPAFALSLCFRKKAAGFL